MKTLLKEITVDCAHREWQYSNLREKYNVTFGDFIDLLKKTFYYKII